MSDKHLKVIEELKDIEKDEVKVEAVADSEGIFDRFRSIFS